MQGDGGMAQEEEKEPPGMYIHISFTRVRFPWAVPFSFRPYARISTDWPGPASNLSSNPKIHKHTPIDRTWNTTTAVDEDGWTTVRTTRRRNPPRHNSSQQQPRLFG